MPINYPTSLDTTTTLPSDRADATPLITNHAEDHNDANLAIRALEARIGIGASTPTTTGHVLTVTGSGATAYQAASAGAGMYNVVTYGADPTNAAASDAGFQAANDAAVAAGGGTLFIPPGNYRFATGFVVGDASGSFTGINVLGLSPQLTTLRWYGSTTGTLMDCDGLKNCDLRGFTLLNTIARVPDTQTLSMSGGASGTFRLVYGGVESTLIPALATAAQVEAAIVTINDAIGFGHVTCSGGPLGTAPVVITLLGRHSAQTTLNFTINSTGLTGTPSVVRTTTGSSMRGIWLRRHSGAWGGTQIGSLNFERVTISAFDVGLQGGNSPVNGTAASELYFNHCYYYNNGVGARFEDANTLDIHYTMLGGSDNGIGILTTGAASNISVHNGSSSNNTIADFAFNIGGGGQGTSALRNYRTEGAKRFLLARGNAGHAGFIVDGCCVTQSSDGPTGTLIYVEGGRLRVSSSMIDGRITGRTNNTPLEINLVNSSIYDTVPFRVSSGVGDTLQGTSYSVTQCVYGGYDTFFRFPDEIGAYLYGATEPTPLMRANLSTSSDSLPNLYLGGGNGGWSAGSLYGGLQVAQIPDPVIDGGAQPIGGTGSTTYSYYIVAIDANGNKTMASSVVTFTNGMAFGSLDASHYNLLQWGTPGSFSAVAYDVIRSVGGTTQGSIALALEALVFSDTGLAASAYTSPTRNATGDVHIDGNLTVDGDAPGGEEFTGSAGFHIVPTTNNTYDLGSASFKWRDLYATRFLLGGTDVEFVREAAGQFGVRSGGGSATWMNLYSSYTDASNYERMVFYASTGGYIFTQHASGSGVLRSLTLNAGYNLLFGANQGTQWVIAAGSSPPGTIYPQSDGDLDLGKTDARLRALFINRVELSEIADPGAGPSNTGRLYVRDNGSGKSQLCVIFASGAVQVLATEP